MSLSISISLGNEQFSAAVLQHSDTRQRWIVCRLGTLSISFRGYDADAVAEARALAAVLLDAADRLDAAVVRDHQLPLPDVTTSAGAVV